MLKNEFPSKYSVVALYVLVTHLGLLLVMISVWEKE